MANTNTEHTKALRQKTAGERRKAIKESGGKDLSNVLLERQDVMKLTALCKWHGAANTPATQTNVIKKLIAAGFEKIPQPEPTEEEVDAVFGAGAVACSNGQKRGDNPHIEGTSLYHEWDNGWRQYDADYNPDYYSSPLADDL